MARTASISCNVCDLNGRHWEIQASADTPQAVEEAILIANEHAAGHSQREHDVAHRALAKIGILPAHPDDVESPPPQGHPSPAWWRRWLK